MAGGYRLQFRCRELGGVRYPPLLEVQHEATPVPCLAGNIVLDQCQCPSFTISGPGPANVDTNPGTEVDLLSALDGTITDLNVFVNITGGHMEDFDLFLTSPDGTTVEFRTDFLNPFTHINPPLLATFDDEAASPHSAQTSGELGPSNPLRR